MAEESIGSIVRCRNREWIVVPSPDENVALLRPLTGSERELCGIYRPLIGMGLDAIEPATFPLPKPEHSGDAIGVGLLWNAARLSLRDGAAPFRSLGRVSVRPRPYQFVPLLMALRIQPVRLLIADDVGIGKTIESLLIAREMLDRGEISRLCVICPPYLCDQWQKELAEKFHIHAEVIRSGTIGRLERELPSGDWSIFNYYPFIVVSIDYVKSDRNRSQFLQFCPDFVIVDEAHGAAQPSTKAVGQQQRHRLLKDLAAKPTRDMIMLTATPHSGVEESFLSLLGLIRPEFAKYNLAQMNEKERIALSQYFIQRRRADIKNWLGETRFPDRETEEITYTLSPAYQDLFKRVYEFSREIVKSGETLKGWKRRIKFWHALALLRCVMSSPAAASAALVNAAKSRTLDVEPAADESAQDDSYAALIYEPTDDTVNDTQPATIIEEGIKDLSAGEVRSIAEFARRAKEIREKEIDSKVETCATLVKKLLKEGYNPIIWCRYIATSDYLADELVKRLGGSYPDICIKSITGAMPEEERREKVDELGLHTRRVLVATDCLSEGVNLQQSFDAVVHYDLPWNPNRLEQREGRVDRFGQPKDKVKAVLLYGRDNPVDGAVLDVLLRKAREIRNSLGITVPVPTDSETVMETVLKTLFFRAVPERQLALTDFIPLDTGETIQNVHKRWDEAAAREKESRTRFAQRAIKPDEIEKELKETDSVLGDPDAVKVFVMNACQRLGVTVSPQKVGSYDAFTLRSLDRLPEMVRMELPDTACQKWEMQIGFTTPVPERIQFLGRNHPLVTSLAQYLFEEALANGTDAAAPRCGVIKSSKVDTRTMLFLLRGRFAMKAPQQKSPLLAEEVIVTGLRGSVSAADGWLAESDALDLLTTVRPEANITEAERHEVLTETIAAWEKLQAPVRKLVEQKAAALEEAHRRVRKSVDIPRRGLAVTPHQPPDLLGILVIIPIPTGASR
ncbi:MAG: ATP-dependent helicase HepA [Methanoregula sp. PtaU1.Bin051]|nr:MAG: ATP-dependent helicase HepA [Methanoregula sp. PtaU1.Bin051]